MNESLPQYVNDEVPVFSGTAIKTESPFVVVPVGVGMDWKPGGNIDTERLQSNTVKLRLHYPADPTLASFEVEASLVDDFSDDKVTSAAAAGGFMVADGVAEYGFSGFTPKDTSENATITFANFRGKTVYIRARAAGKPWSRTVSTTIYFPDADQFYADSMLPTNPRTAGGEASPTGITIMTSGQGSLEGLITVLGSTAQADGKALVRIFAAGHEILLADPQSVAEVSITAGDTPSEIASAIASEIDQAVDSLDRVTLAAQNTGPLVTVINSEQMPVNSIDVLVI